MLPSIARKGVLSLFIFVSIFFQHVTKTFIYWYMLFRAQGKSAQDSLSWCRLIYNGISRLVKSSFNSFILLRLHVRRWSALALDCWPKHCRALRLSSRLWPCSDSLLSCRTRHSQRRRNNGRLRRSVEASKSWRAVSACHSRGTHKGLSSSWLIARLILTRSCL